MFKNCCLRLLIALTNWWFMFCRKKHNSKILVFVKENQIISCKPQKTNANFVKKDRKIKLVLISQSMHTKKHKRWRILQELVYKLDNFFVDFESREILVFLAVKTLLSFTVLFFPLKSLLCRKVVIRFLWN